MCKITKTKNVNVCWALHLPELYDISLPHPKTRKTSSITDEQHKENASGGPNKTEPNLLLLE